MNGDNVIYDRLRAGRPVLGVCVGEQIMFTRGTEHDLDTPGLQLIDGEVSRLDADVVPHIGWDTVDAPEGSVLLKAWRANGSISCTPTPLSPRRPADLTQFDIDLGDAEQKVAFCDYSRSHFVASYERGPLFATQFHPEKSAQAGARLLANWAAVL